MTHNGVILDTDIGPDCDDAAAIALAARYCQKSGRDLLAVMHCTSGKWGVGAIRDILNWYGYGGVSVGTLKEPGFLCGPQYEKYNKILAMRVGEAERDAPDCIPLYRKILAEAPDAGVEIIAIGPLRNLRNLLVSAKDEISPLSGRELIARKVSRLTLMAGEFSEGCDRAEWNVLMDIGAARQVAENWPGEMVYCGYEVGSQVVTLAEPEKLPEENPVRLAYAMYCGKKGRMSWDLCTVQWAMADTEGLYDTSAGGTIKIDEAGVSRWIPGENGAHRFVRVIGRPESIRESLERALL